MATTQGGREHQKTSKDFHGGFSKAPLGATLRKGDIRLLRVAWLLQQPDGYLLQTRQELEALRGRAGAPARRARLPAL